MNVSILIGGLSGGGAERVVSNLSNHLSERHDVTIVTMTEDSPAYFIDEKVKIRYLIRKDDSSDFVTKNIKRYKNLREYVHNQKADIFIVFLPVTTNLLLSLRKSIKVPIIVSERGDPIFRFKSSKIQKFFMKYLYPRADNFVFQTDDSKIFYKEVIGVSGVVIPNAINEGFIKKNKVSNPQKRIISVGRLNKQKNFELLIKAFAQINSKIPEYKLEVLGEGPLREPLNNLIVDLNLSDKVSLPGYVNNVDEKLMNSSLFVLPSNYEGMPNALMEAMAIGLPCISTDCPIGGPKYLIDDGVNGFLVPLNDQENLARKMLLTLSDAELQKKLGNNSKKIVDELDPETIYTRWEQLLLETVASY